MVTTMTPLQTTKTNHVVTFQNNGTTGHYEPWPIQQWPYWGGYYQVVTPPTTCAGDVHVFPCPHCDRCKCGAATKTPQP